MSLISQVLQRMGLMRVSTDGRPVDPDEPTEVPVDPDAPTVADDVKAEPEPRLSELYPPGLEPDSIMDVRPAVPDPIADHQTVADEEPSGPTHEVLTLDELMAAFLASDAEHREQSLATRAGLDATWDDIYDAAGLGPAHEGFTIEHVADLVEASPDADPTALRMALLEGMSRAGTRPSEVLGDALARDEALDLYEKILTTSVGDVKAELRAEADEVRRQIAELEQRIETLSVQAVDLDAQVSEWKARKRGIEERWQRVVGHLVKSGDGPPSLIG